MPAIKPGQQNRPDMPQIPAWGMRHYGRGPGTNESHFPGYDEWWVLTNGGALIRAAGEAREAAVVYEDIEGVWFDGPRHGRKRWGRLRHLDDD